MSEKEEVLRQISEIKNHLVDRETFFPYNHNAYYVWSIIAVILTLVMIPSYDRGIVFGTATATIFIVIGFIIEGVLIKKVNESYDIEDCTKKQQFMMKSFFFLSIFLIVLSAVLATYKLYLLIYLMWLFLISVGYFLVGFVMNINKFTYIAQFNMTLTVGLMIIGTYFELFESRDMLITTVVQAIVIFGLAVLPSWVARHQQKVEYSV